MRREIASCPRRDGPRRSVHAFEHAPQIASRLSVLRRQARVRELFLELTQPTEIESAKLSSVMKQKGTILGASSTGFALSSHCYRGAWLLGLCSLAMACGQSSGGSSGEPGGSSSV